MPIDVLDYILQPSQLPRRDVIAVAHVSRSLRGQVFESLSHQLKVKIVHLERRHPDTKKMLPQDDWLRLADEFGLLVSMSNADMGVRPDPGFWPQYISDRQKIIPETLRDWGVPSRLETALQRHFDSANASAQIACEGLPGLTVQDVKDAEHGIAFRLHASKPQHRARVAALALMASALQKLGPGRLRAQLRP